MRYSDQAIDIYFTVKVLASILGFSNPGLLRGKNPITEGNQPNGLDLKVIPSGHSSATWCYIVNASIVYSLQSMRCLPTSVQKEWCVGFHYRND